MRFEKTPDRLDGMRNRGFDEFSAPSETESFDEAKKGPPRAGMTLFKSGILELD
jgi:hypothetical protein